MGAARGLTRELAAFAVRQRYSDWPKKVQTELGRTFLNWMGCALGGCQEEAVEIARATVIEAGGFPQATLIGHGQRADVASAAFVNCLSSSAFSFDDTHLATVIHPTGPVAASLLAFAESHGVTGQEFANALGLGIEIQCRIGNALLQPPAKANLGFYITGLVGPIGVAVALGSLMRFDEARMACAIGLAATQGAGVRATHGGMSGLIVPAFGARSGIQSALLAEKGFTCPDDLLESERGFINVFASGADPNIALQDLGEKFEILTNAYKPYPSGIVIHPAIDACLEIAGQLPRNASIASVRLAVHPLTLTLTDRRHPVDPLEAQVSVYHWVAVSLLRRQAGVAELQQDCIDSAEIRAMRSLVEVVDDPSFGREAACAEVALFDGTVLRAEVTFARGSAGRPMSDAELDHKFTIQATRLLPAAAADHLLALCRNVASLANPGAEIAALLGVQA